MIEISGTTVHNNRERRLRTAIQAKDAEIERLRKEISSLNAKLETHREWVADLNEKIKLLQSRLFKRAVKKNQERRKSDQPTPEAADC